jgi:hypothetical protein
MMKDVQLLLTIPAELASDAEDVGLLEPEAILAALREVVDQRIMAMVDAEVKAYRREKQVRDENS